MKLFDLMPALLLTMLNGFVPGPNVANTIGTAMGSGPRGRRGLRLRMWRRAFAMGAYRAVWRSCTVWRAVPVAQAELSALGGLLLQYFSFRYF